MYFDVLDIYTFFVCFFLLLPPPPPSSWCLSPPNPPQTMVELDDTEVMTDRALECLPTTDVFIGSKHSLSAAAASQSRNIKVHRA